MKDDDPKAGRPDENDPNKPVEISDAELDEIVGGVNLGNGQHPPPPLATDDPANESNPVVIVYIPEH